MGKSILLIDVSGGSDKKSGYTPYYKSINVSDVSTKITEAGLTSNHEITSAKLRIEPCYYKLPDVWFDSSTKNISTKIWLCNDGGDNSGISLLSTGNIPEDSGGAYSSETIYNYLSKYYPFSMNTTYPKMTIYFTPSGSAWDWKVYYKVYLDIEYKDHAHNFKSSIIKDAACTEAGTIKYTCDCGDYYTEITNPIGHNWNSTSNVGYKICLNCSAKERLKTPIFMGSKQQIEMMYVLPDINVIAYKTSGELPAVNSNALKNSKWRLDIINTDVSTKYGGQTYYEVEKLYIGKDRIW